MEETSFINEMLSNLFVRGLVVGIVLCLVVWIRSFFRVRGLNNQLNKLRGHLHTKLEIDSEANERRKGEADQLKKERDNLRNMIQILNQKPGRQEMRQHHIYQKALDIMFEKAPGFAPTWQITLREAEEEMKNAEKGLIPFLRRIKPSTSKSFEVHQDTGQNKAIEFQKHSGK